MGERARSALAALLLSAALISPSLAVPGSALAQGACPPEPPYGEPAFIVEVKWAEPVRMNYGVATSVAPLSGEQTALHQYVAGDFAVSYGGCGDPIKPMLITRRDTSRGEVDPGEQAEAGVGTYSVCGTGGDWAGMNPEFEAPGEPWTYTLLVEGTGPCEGAYEDVRKAIGEPTLRKQPESAAVTATVSYYAAFDTAPSKAWDISAQVGVLNSRSLENARYGVGDYQRPLPVALATLTLPPIGSDGDGQVTPTTTDEPAGSDKPAQTGKATERAKLPGITRWLGLTRLAAPPASYGESASGEEPAAPMTAEERRALAYLMMALLLSGDVSLFLEAALTGDWGGAIERLQGDDDDSSATTPPTKSPPAMGRKAFKQGWRWVWLPAEAKVRTKGATRYLKPGVWYQTKVGKEGDRTFYNKKGKLIGKTDDEVEVKVWGKEADPNDLPRLFSDAIAGTTKRQPANPPPARPLNRKQNLAQHWVYVTLPTQTYSEEYSEEYEEYDLVKEHVLMPGRWYVADSSSGRITGRIYTADGRWLGDEVNEDYLQVSPTTPLQVEGSAD